MKKYPQFIKCKVCNISKSHNEFRWKSNGLLNGYVCDECKSNQNKEYRKIHEDKLKISDKAKYEKNKEKLLAQQKNRYESNKEEILAKQKVYNLGRIDELKNYRKKYHQDHQEELNEKSRERGKKYRENNKKEIRNKKKEYAKNKRKNDTNFKIKENISKSIRYQLSLLNSNKNNESCINYLPFSINELKYHLENLFESWMSWENHGKYIKSSWNDDNKSTWTWQIDHIVPQAELPYASMVNENFKKCWGLENLRPYPSKQNVLDGASRIRHKK